MKNLLSVLLNEPFMVEESWLKQAVEFFGSVKIEDPKAFFLDDDRGSEAGYTVVGRTAHVPITGPIFPRPNILTEWFGVGVALSNFSADLKQLVADDSIDSIVLNVDSPGGSVTGVNETANIIKAASAVKPVTAYVSGTGASAAYWLASSASEIVLDPTSRVGSIGVVVAHSKSEDGEIEIVNSASPNKRPDPTTEQGRAVIISQLDELANVFIEAVAANRRVPVSTVMNDFGKGGIVVGQRAVSIGMADRLGSLDELLTNKEDTNTGDNYMTLTIEELKEKHTDIYNAVVKSVSDEMSVKISAKEAEITSLQTQLASAVQTSVSMEERIRAIEKAEIIRQERENKAVAEGIMATTLSESKVPQRLHPKVATQINYEQFVKDGKLDVTAYSDAVKTEVSDWEKEFASLPISGIATTPRVLAGNPDDGADDEAVARLLGHIGIKEDK